MQRFSFRTTLAALGLLAIAVPAGAAGFGIFEQGTRAMGLAGAFTGRADDPSAMWHNAGGLAFTEKRDFLAGVTYNTLSEGRYEGVAGTTPGAGASGERATLTQFPPHAYWAEPLSDTWKFGVGIESPFGLVTEWKDPETFPGRFLSTKVALRAVDVNPTLAWRPTPSLGLGLGVSVRFSDVELNRHLPFLTPTGQLLDVGTVKLDSAIERGYGWNVGLLHRFSETFSWGVSYRSRVEVDYEGTGRFTQIPTGVPSLDAAVAANIPFDRDLDVSTSIEFPDLASVGVSLAVSPNVRLGLDANWTGWSSFDEVPLRFSQVPPLSSVIQENWNDAWNYRAGVSWAASSGNEWRFGYLYEESPVPDQSVSPRTPDATRSGFTVGFGHQFATTSLDLALMYLPLDERTTTSNGEGFNGTYNTTAWLFGVSVGF
jgi:long-chain fatty acid transport protein